MQRKDLAMNRTLYLNMYQKTFIYILLLVSLSACTPKTKHYVIGVSQCSEDIWRDKLNEELSISSFSNENVDIRFASADDNDQRQVEQIIELMQKVYQ